MIMRDWTGRIVLGDEWALFVGAGGCTPLHQHLAYKIVIGLDRPIKILDADGGVRKGRVLQVLAGAKHQVFAEGTRVGLYYVDAGAFQNSSLPSAAELRALVSLCKQIGLGDMEAIRSLNTNFTSSGPSISESRVIRAVDLLRQQEAVELGQIASQIGLSSSRLSHLFTAQVGGAPVSYRKWRRLWVAAELLGRGERIVDAALEAGFSDSAHLTRTFVKMLSITPGVFQKSEVILLTSAFDKSPSL